jgi:hypothetical protein
MKTRKNHDSFFMNTTLWILLFNNYVYQVYFKSNYSSFTLILQQAKIMSFMKEFYIFTNIISKKNKNKYDHHFLKMTKTLNEKISKWWYFTSVLQQGIKSNK